MAASGRLVEKEGVFDPRKGARHLTFGHPSPKREGPAVIIFLPVLAGGKSVGSTRIRGRVGSPGEFACITRRIDVSSGVRPVIMITATPMSLSWREPCHRR